MTCFQSKDTFLELIIRKNYSCVGSDAAYTEGVQLVHLTPVLGTARLLCMSMVVSVTNISVANLLTKFGKIPTDSEKI